MVRLPACTRNHAHATERRTRRSAIYSSSVAGKGWFGAPIVPNRDFSGVLRVSQVKSGAQNFVHRSNKCAPGVPVGFCLASASPALPLRPARVRAARVAHATRAPRVAHARVRRRACVRPTTSGCQCRHSLCLAPSLCSALYCALHTSTRVQSTLVTHARTIDMRARRMEVACTSLWVDLS